MWYWHQSRWWRYHFMKFCNQQAQRLYMIFHTLLVLFPQASDKQTVSRILLSWKVWMPTRYKFTKFTCMCQLQKGLFTFLCSFRHSYQGRVILEATFKLLYFTCGICHLFCEDEDHDCFTFADLYTGNLYMYNPVRLPHPQNCSVNFWHKWNCGLLWDYHSMKWCPVPMW